MPATEPDEPELPLWPEARTEPGGPAAPSPASRAGEGAASPTPPADVPPAVHDRPGPAPWPVPPGAEPSRWDDRARRRQYDRGELHASGDRLGVARPRPPPPPPPPPARRCRPPGERDAVAAADDPVPGRGLTQARVRHRARAGGRDVSGFRVSDGGRTCRPARAGREPAPTGQALRSAAASRGADHQKWPRTIVSLKGLPFASTSAADREMGHRGWPPGCEPARRQALRVGEPGAAVGA